MIPNSGIEIYHSSDGQTEIEVTFDNETVWLNQEQLSQLFERDRTVIGRHIRSIFSEGELVEEVVCADFAHTTQHGAIKGKTQTKKAATLLYLVTKNHAFADGNKRIAAACFLLFLEKNGMLSGKDGRTIISNEALASITLFVAISKPDEMEAVKRLIVSILNRNI